VKVNRITIENFRGIRELSLNLAFPLTVFTGKNGAGKSSILDCLAALLSWYPARLGSPRGRGSFFKKTDIGNFQNTTQGRISVAVAGDVVTEWGLGIDRKANKKYFHRVNSEAFSQDNPGPNIPLVVHYSVHRTVLDIPLRIRGKIDLTSPLTAFAGAFHASSNFRAFFSWFRQREDLENEKRWDRLVDADLPDEMLAQSIRKQRDPQLQAVRSAVTIFTGFTDLRVYRDPLHMGVKKAEKKIWVDHLSDGEKCLLALVGDLARRLAILSGSSGQDPLSMAGVVLIDEIDLHLHPAWQREILPKLVQTFSNCQFIVSTHSPQILSDVRPEAIFQLHQTSDGIKVSHPQDSYGQTSNRILEDTMDVPERPERIKEKLRLLFDSIAQKELPVAREQVLELEKILGSDPDLVRANTLIRRYEVLGQ